MMEFFKKIFPPTVERTAQPLHLPLSDAELEKGMWLLHKHVHGLENVFAGRIFRNGSENIIIINKHVAILMAANDETYTHYRIYVDDIAVLMLCASLGRQNEESLSLHLMGASESDAELFYTGRIYIGTPIKFRVIPKQFQIVMTPILRALIAEGEKESPKSVAVQKLVSLTYKDVA